MAANVRRFDPMGYAASRISRAMVFPRSRESRFDLVEMRMRFTHAPGSPIALPARQTLESGGDFPKDFGVEFGQPDQRLCRAAWLPAPLLPLLQGPPRNSQQSGELRLRQSRFQACANHG